MNEHHVSGKANAMEANQTISIGDVTFSIARLALPASDIEVTVVVGEIIVPADADGAPAARLVGIGTAVQPDATPVDNATIRIDYVRHDREEKRSSSVEIPWREGSSRHCRQPRGGHG